MSWVSTSSAVGAVSPLNVVQVKSMAVCPDVLSDEWRRLASSDAILTAAAWLIGRLGSGACDDLVGWVPSSRAGELFRPGYHASLVRCSGSRATA
jgi:hypothetical protein